MLHLRSSLLCLFLGLLSVLALKLLCLADQASSTLTQVNSAVALMAPPLAGAAIELRGAAREQRTYYKATGKALFLATRDFDRLVENTDQRTAQVLAQVHATLKSTQDAVALVGLDSHEAIEAAQKQVEENGYEAGLALAAARGNFEQMEKLWPPLLHGAQNTDTASENIAAATHSIQVALAPLEKPTGKLKWVLKTLLGLPKINVR